MVAPARVASFSALVLLCTLACRGDIIVNWLDEPLWLNDEPPPVIGQPDRHYIDLDRDGTTDFSFSGIWNISVDFRSEGANRYLVVPDPPPNIGGGVAALEYGSLIGAGSGDTSLDWFGDHYDFWSTLMLDLDPGREGEFWDTRAFIGMEFQMDDGIHYGWFDVEGSTSVLPQARIYGWAYESTPGMGISAGAIPEPSIVLLFVGGIVAVLRSRAKYRIR